MTDITQHKKTRQALRHSQQLLQSTMGHLPAVIAYKDREGRFLNVNKAVEKALGCRNRSFSARGRVRRDAPGT